MWFAAVFVGLPNPDLPEHRRRAARRPRRRSRSATCVQTVTSDDGQCTRRRRTATWPARPPRPGCSAGDLVTKVGTTPVTTYGQLTDAIRALAAGPGPVRATPATAQTAHRHGHPGHAPSAPPIDDPSGTVTQVAVAGVGWDTDRARPDHVRPGRRDRGHRRLRLDAWSRARSRRSSGSRRRSRRCGTRSPATSVTRTPRSAWSAPAGSAARRSRRACRELFLMIFIALNIFIGIFNLLPLLPLDGGHIAIAWFERVRSWLYARLAEARPRPRRLLQADAGHVRGDPDRWRVHAADGHRRHRQPDHDLLQGEC